MAEKQNRQYTVLDYVRMRGDLRFDQDPFNEVDNLVFSIVSYAEMRGLVNEGEVVTIEELYQRYETSGYDQSQVVYDPRPLMKEMAPAARYRDVKVSHYVDMVDENNHFQFSAVTFHLPESELFVAFRGTDITLVGWREDFNMTVKKETPAQQFAVYYLSQSFLMEAKSIYVGGHSKGGNLAVYGSAFCDPLIREKITAIYSNDGPGFRHEAAEAEEIKSILPRVIHIIPDTSVIGLLLDMDVSKVIIQSTLSHFTSHNPYSWCVYRNRFERAEELTGLSIFIEDVFSKWLETINDEDRKNFVDTVFDSFEKAGVYTVEDLDRNHIVTYNAILEAFNHTDPAMRKLVINLFLRLVKTGTDTAVQEIRKTFFQEKKED